MATHVVQPGDTLWRIARRHGISVERLREANGLTGNLIMPGQLLQIPERRAATPGAGPARRYKVISGPAMLRSGPGENRRPILPLPVGAEVQALRQEGNWVQVQTDERRRGWVRREFLEPLRETAPPATPQDWPMAGREPRQSHFGRYPLRPPLTPAWMAPVQPGGGGAAIVGNTVYVIRLATRPGLVALDLRTGRQRWHVDLASVVDRTTPLVRNGIVYVVGDSLVAVRDEGDRGRVLWNQPYRSTLPAVAGRGNLYISGGPIRAINPITGQLNWQGPASEKIVAADPPLLFVVEGPFLTCLEDQGATFAVRWRQLLGTQDLPLTTPAVQEGRLYIATEGQRIYALEAGSGRQLWVADAQVRGHQTGPAIGPDRLIFNTVDNDVVCFNLHNGEFLWTTDVGPFVEEAEQEQFGPSPIIAGKTVYVGSSRYPRDARPGGYLIALDLLTGDPLWSDVMAGDGYVGGPLSYRGDWILAPGVRLLHAWKR